METIGNFPDLASAKLAQSVLKASEIDAEIPDEYLAGVDWQLGTALHGVRLLVAPEDADAARSLLEARVFNATNEATNQELGESNPDDLCPVCRSTSIGPPHWRRRLKALGLLFAPVLLLWPIFAARSRDSACFACGHTWNGAS